MKDLKLKENEVVHCKTEKQAKKVLKIAHKIGLKWDNGISYKKNTYWIMFEENSVYYLNEGTYGSVKRISKKYTIITSKEFLKRHKKDKTDKLEDTLEVESDIPKVGDIVKAWGCNKSDFIYGALTKIYNSAYYDYRVGGSFFNNIEKAPEEIIKYFK